MKTEFLQNKIKMCVGAERLTKDTPEQVEACRKRITNNMK